MSAASDDKPPFPLVQGALRFALEIAANVAIGRWAWAHGGWLGTVVAVAACLMAWTVFNVPGDPSRGGGAPVPVPGAVRLIVEGVVFATGALALWATARWGWAIGFGVLLALHYAATWRRVRWLLTQ
jgi:hypothetical protein